MSNILFDSYTYENLKPISVFNEQTKLCIYEPTNKLFVVKKADISCKPIYETIKSLNNPHLAKIIFISEKTDYIEIVREYISGDPLSELIKGGSNIERNLAVKITKDICDGLSDIHRLGYVHRDITPNNIIISSDGCAKIIDFGIARSFSEEKSADTSILGTPGYAAPEQFGFSQSDARTDIYAVGVLLNVMLTGCLPNEKAATGKLGKIIRKCCAIDSLQRYASVLDLKNELCNKINENNIMDRVINQMPGLRSKNPFIVTLAIIGYVSVIMFSVVMFSTVKNNAYFFTIAAWILLFFIPFFCFNNFLDIYNKLPFSKGASKRNQRIVYIILGIMSILFGIIVFGLTN